MNRSLFQLALIVMLAATGCVKRSELDALTVEVRDLTLEGDELSKQLSSLNDEFKTKNNLAIQFQRLQEREATLKLELEQITKYVDDLKAAQSYADSRLPQWRDATRRSLAGLKLGNLSLINGNSLVDAEVVEVTEDTVKLKHIQGEGDYQLEDLPESARLLLVHEPTIVARAKIGN